MVFQPISTSPLTVDYYNIEKTGAITAPSNAPALLAYYTGQPIPAGYTVVADAPDVNHPLATPRVAFVEAQLINANTVKTSGYDMQATFQRDIWYGIHLTTSANLTYIQLLETVFPDGHTERYDGTLGNFNLTAGSGTPKWHGKLVHDPRLERVRGYCDG